MTTSTLKNRRRQDIDRSRGRLDDTLEELTHKIDVPARIRDKVHDAKEDVRVIAEEVEQQEQTEADDVNQQVHEVTEELEAKAGEVAQQADHLTRQVLAELPSPVDERIEPLMPPVRQGPLLIAAVAMGVLLVMLVLRRLLRGSR
jgi:methyl-accepting chemotaxis protein